MLRLVRVALDTVGLTATLDALRGLYRASPRLMLSIVGLSWVAGVLLPAFSLASGALVEAVRSGGAVGVPLALVGLIFGSLRVLDPLRQELSNALTARVDRWIGDRIMASLSAPPGLEAIEDPGVRDQIVQAEGTLIGFTPGESARHLGNLISLRIQGLLSLVIVASVYWWAALALFGVYLVAYNVTRAHHRNVTVLVYQRASDMRRAYYLRSLALSSQVAKEIRVFDLAGWLVGRYRSSSLAIFNEVWSKRNEGWVRAVGLAVLLIVIEGVVLGTVVMDATAGRISLATATAVTLAALSASALSMFQEGDEGLTEADSSLRKIAELEHAAASARGVSSKGRSADGLPRQAIRFVDVTFTYPGRAEPVLEHFNLEIEVGRSLAIVGENGAGKTTLVKLLTRLYEPTSGRIMVDELGLAELAPASWHRRAAAVFQDFARFELAAYDNVAFGALHAASDSAGVERAAADAGAVATIERLPNGWQTLLSREFRGGAELSGGEWQRLALARALFGVAKGAGVLILDEPTASLDVRGEAEVYARFLELTPGVTTIVISHRFSTVRRADRIVVIEGGRVVEDGTHDSLVSQGGRYAEMYALQASRFSDAAESERPNVDGVDAVS